MLGIGWGGNVPSIPLPSPEPSVRRHKYAKKKEETRSSKKETCQKLFFEKLRNQKNKIKNAKQTFRAQVGPALPKKRRRRRPLTHSASFVFSVFRETRWVEAGGGRMYAVRVLEEAGEEEEEEDEEEEDEERKVGRSGETKEMEEHDEMQGKWKG